MNQQSDAQPGPSRRGLAGWTTWLAGLVVALGAVGATAHGLYVVAEAAGAPQPIAWLYPLITDGLALVAYACTAQLTGPGRRYAWTVVVLAAGLSGLAQASYLAGGVTSAPPELRFGVGAWPAVAAAIVAHLLFLLSTGNREAVQPSNGPSVQPQTVQAETVQPAPVQPVQPAVGTAHRPPAQPGVQDRRDDGVQRGASQAGDRRRLAARELALQAATHHAHTAGGLPTARELAALAGVSRGTAATALQELRHQPLHLHVITRTPEPSTTE